MRIPRKIKKKYKKFWCNIKNEKRFFIKKTIGFEYSGDRKIWGCFTRLKKDYELLKIK
jgi:hypothetical protein